MRAPLSAVFNPAAENARLNADYADLQPLAEEHGIAFHRFRKLSDPETIEQMRRLAPDVIFVLGLSQLVPPEMLSIPKLGCIGSHPALLPQNRGRHPLIWALVDGLTESGLTLFMLDDGVDSGDIVWQERFPITESDTAATLYEKVEQLATRALHDLVPQIERGTLPRRPQDHAAATYRRKRTADDGEVLWSWDARRVHNLIRALTHPYPGAHTFVDQNRIVLWKSRVRDTNTPHTRPGEVLDVHNGSAVVACGVGAVEIAEWDPAVTLQPSSMLGRRS